MDKLSEKELQELCISEGKITPSKDKDSSRDSKSNASSRKNSIYSLKAIKSKDKFFQISPTNNPIKQYFNV